MGHSRETYAPGPSISTTAAPRIERRRLDLGHSSGGLSMRPESIFAPMVVLVFLTFAVMVYMGIKRFGAGFAGRVRAGDFRYGETANVPPDVAVANRNFMNLLEAPVLFYTLALAVFVTHQVTEWMLGLAWLYVALRIVHTFIHLSYNKILHRFSSYAASNLVLHVMWLKFAVSLAMRAG